MVSTWSSGRCRGAAARAALFVALGVVAAAGLAGPARAGQDPGLRLGYYAGADADDAVPSIGVFGRIDVPGPLNVEVSADYRREQLRGGDLRATVVPVRLTAVLSFAPVVSPYLAAGVGADFVRLEFRNALADTADDSSLALEGHAGGGVEITLGPLSLIADLRYCAVEKVSSDALRSALGHDYDPSGWLASLSAGISF